MVAILPPDLSLTFIIAALIPLIIGFVVGLIIKKVLTIGLVIAALLLVLIIAGFLAPDQVLKPLAGLVKSGSTLADWVKRIAGYLPLTSLTFLLGLIIGFVKG